MVSGRSVTALTAHLNWGAKFGLDIVGGQALLAGAASKGDGGLGTMQYLLMLLVAVTMACGVAATVTIELAPAYADGGAKGY